MRIHSTAGMRRDWTWAPEACRPVPRVSLPAWTCSLSWLSISFITLADQWVSWETKGNWRIERSGFWISFKEFFWHWKRSGSTTAKIWIKDYQGYLNGIKWALHLFCLYWYVSWRMEFTLWSDYNYKNYLSDQYITLLLRLLSVTSISDNISWIIFSFHIGGNKFKEGNIAFFCIF